MDGRPIFLDRKDIDIERWDLQISKSKQRRIYAYSWWLDAVTQESWQAFILGDHYSTIMPVFIKRKWGIIPYYFRPFLTQQSGIFSHSLLDISTQQTFLKALHRKVLFIDTTLHGFHIPENSSWSVLENHLVDLTIGYDSINNNYNRLTKRNISKALKSSFEISMETDPSEFLNFLLMHMPYKLNQSEQIIISTLLSAGKERNLLDIFWIRKQGSPHGCGACMRDGERVYFILTATDQYGKNCSSSFLLIDHMIQYYEGKGIHTFDFTGSNIPNIARRNLGFGADVEPYYRYQKNAVPLSFF